MTDVSARGGAVSLVVGAVVVLSVAAPAAAAAPDVAVRVDGSTLADGGSITVTDDPEVTVEVSAESPIDSVSVRVDGEPRHTFSPDSESFSETVTLDLTDGDYDLTVVASAAETTTHGGTVVKDSVGPRVRYTSPFTTSRKGSPDDVETVAHGNTTVAGELYDRSGVDRVVIERVYEWRFAGETRSDKETHRIDDPGDSFSRPLLLGPGANEMRVRLTDVHGHERIQTYTIDLTDRTEPEIRIDTVERLGDGSKVRVNGTVSDDTKVRSLSYTLGGSTSEKSVLTEVDSEPTRERLSAEFEFTATAGENVGSLALTAADTAGNTRTKEVSLNFEQRVAPAIRLDGDATALDGDEVRVVGTVADGRVTRVTVETVGPDGEVLDLRTVHDGGTAQRVAIDARLAAAGEGTRIVVRAVDTMGRDHTESFRVQERAADSGEGTGTVEAATADDRDGSAVGGGRSGDGADGDGIESEAEGATPFPVAGPVGLVVAAVSLAAVGLVGRRVLGGAAESSDGDGGRREDGG